MSETNGVAKPPKYPFALGFQKDVLALMTRDPGFLMEMSDALDAKYFDGDALTIVARLLIGHAKKYGQRPSKNSLLTRVMRHFEKYELDDDLQEEVLQLIHNLYRRELPSDLAFVREQVADFGRLAALKWALHDSVDLLAKHPADLVKQQQIVPLLTKALSVGTGQRIGIQLFDAPDEPSRFRGQEGDPQRKVPTPWPTLNYARRGGLGAGELGVILGEPARGKSMALVNIAAHAALVGRRVVYVSTELREYDVICRLLARMTKRELPEVEDEHPDFKSAAQALKGGDRYIRVAAIRRGAPVTVIRSLVSRIVANDGVDPEVLVIDYADELSPSRSDFHHGDSASEHGYYAYGDIYYELTNLATDYHCPIWTASQVNRLAYGAESFGMEAASDSIKKAQVADAILCLCQSDDEEKTNRMRIWVDKLRRGKSKFSIGLKVDFLRCMMRERGPTDAGTAKSESGQESTNGHAAKGE